MRSTCAALRRRSPSNVPVVGLGLPGRHVSRACYLGDLRCATPHIVVGEQREWPAAAVPVAGSAMSKDNGRDVAVESDRTPAFRRLADHGSGGKQTDEQRSNLPF